MKRFLATLVLLNLCLTGHADAQSKGFALDRFDRATSGSDWFAGESLDFRGDPRPALGLTLDWAHKPLVLYDAQGREAAALIENQLYSHVGGSFVLWNRLRFGANLPLALWQTGQNATLGATTIASSRSATIGDLRLGADVRLLGEYGDAFTLALGVQAHLPTGSQSAYTGDGKWRVAPRLMVAGDIAAFAYSARAAYAYRAQDQDLAGVPTGSELLFVATAGVRVADKRLLLGPELWGSTVVNQSGAAFRKATTPFELAFGGHYKIPSWILGLGIGPGLTRGLGAPSLRVLASIDWQPEIEPPPAPQPTPEPPPPTPHHDVVAAPEQAPPPPDRDGDSIPDAEDACPNTKGRRSADPSENGCPPDRDGDGIEDDVDACPDAFGEANRDPSKNGCPTARVEQGQIKILERIEFKTNSAELLESSTPVLEAVRKLMLDHDDIAHVSVEGHTDNKGAAAYNERLSQRRAKAVLDWLAKHGIARGRLESHGFGLSRPLETNDTPEGRDRNRRVEFHIQGAGGGSPKED
jgi:OOP family OmpA-OmpF porin